MDTVDVVIVDDDPDTREILEMVLATLPLSLRIVSDGQQALDVIRHDPPALVVLDLEMPGVDGFGVVRQLKASAETATIPVIVFTANHVNLETAKRLDVPLFRIQRKGSISLTELRDIVVHVLRYEAGVNLEA